MIGFGVFDHVDDSGRPHADQFEERLRLAKAIEAAGFDNYHVAEHHGTRLGLAASPSVYLAAVARETSTLRFGPLVYLAALHQPMRLYEEICMLDQLSRGRLLLGLGRGGVWLEQRLFGIDPETVPARYAEARDLLLSAFASDTVRHEGEHFRVPGFATVLKPYQRPHPPLWYGLGSVGSARWAAANDVNVVSLLPAAGAAGLLAAYREEWARLGKDATALPALGINRHIVVAPTRAEALRIANGAFPRWRANFSWLWDREAVPFPLAFFPADWDGIEAAGLGIAGDPEAVAAYLADQRAQTGCTYFGCHMVFGQLEEADASRSIALFGAEVMPRLRGQPISGASSAVAVPSSTTSTT